jgi:hypothetical protein
VLKVGVAGLAKNTGKTTFAQTLLLELESREVRFGITSIGFDGEDVDTVTGLPKPKYYLPEGSLVVTSRNLLRLSTARYRKIREYPSLETPLGPLVLIETASSGSLPIAGPPTRATLRQVLEDLEGLGARLAVVDGAFNRIAPFTVLDAVAVTTGPSRSEDLKALAEEVKVIEKVFNLPRFEGFPRGLDPGIYLLDEGGGGLVRLAEGEFFCDELPPSSGSLRRGGVLIFNSFVTLRLATYLVRAVKPSSVVFRDPITLVLSSSSIVEVGRVLASLEGGGVRAHLLGGPALLCIAVNPCRVGLNPETARFEKRCYPPEAVLKAVREAVTKTPVVDVVYERHMSLYELIEEALRGLSGV